MRMLRVSIAAYVDTGSSNSTLTIDALPRLTWGLDDQGFEGPLAPLSAMIEIFPRPPAKKMYGSSYHARDIVSHTKPILGS
jgi:streptogramin lyase